MKIRRIIKNKIIEYKNKKKCIKKMREEVNILNETMDKNTKNIILYLLPDADVIGGGVISIASMHREAKLIKDIHNAEVLGVKYPCSYMNPNFSKFTKFDNDMYLYLFDSIVKYFSRLESIVLNIPEYIIPEFINNYDTKWNKVTKAWWLGIEYRHINIMNQNIELMPEPECVENLKNFSTHVTQTTAHDRYANLEIKEKYGIPLHHLSVASNKNKFYKTEFENKEKIMMFSPDDKVKNKHVISILQNQFSDFEFVTVENMTYEEYKQLCSKAMFSFTFGEGLDGYYTQPMQSGGVSFAIYNEKFFMPEYSELPNIYENYGALCNNICNDIVKLQDKNLYQQINKQTIDILNKYYSLEGFRKNLKDFYLGNYTFK